MYGDLSYHCQCHWLVSKYILSIMDTDIRLLLLGGYNNIEGEFEHDLVIISKKIVDI